MAAHHVWIVQDRKDRIRAVGAGTRGEAYAELGGKLDKHRDKGTVRLSRTTFTTAADARAAASLVADALVHAGVDKVPELFVGDDGTGFALDLPTRRKVLHYDDLHHAVIVRTGPDELRVDGRLVSGRHEPKVAADVVRASLPLGRAHREDLDVRRLVAVTDAAVDPPRVLGIWKVDDPASWEVDDDGEVQLGLRKRKKGDRGGHVGRRFDWDGYRAGAVGYSHDLRVTLGLAEPHVDDD